MISYGFKGGIGTASRKLPIEEGGYTVGVLVNANHGRRPELTVAGVPVGRLYEGETAATPLSTLGRETEWKTAGQGSAEGSIIIVIGTDAPLDARQLSRVAKRAALGLARTGSTARHGSGDFMLAFSTGNVIPHYPKESIFSMAHLSDAHINPILTATVEASEEAVLNALTAATTVVGRDGHRAEARAYAAPRSRGRARRRRSRAPR